MTKRKRLGDAAKPGSYEINSAFCNTASHDRQEEERLSKARIEKERLEQAKREGRNIGVPQSAPAAKKGVARPTPGGVAVSVGKDGKVWMSKAARRKLKKTAKKR
ncbi:hypothetical protein KFE25_013528 [Diacronema lutheri]|uniref:Uncharacterized protein n=1 Tax=Diacronema lutheri TaxID=2081491 RepID=A0A8J5XZJ3_DIALT|nr:hypothetical protein KFE25_013528 [Diacronema lutheri]